MCHSHSENAALELRYIKYRGGSIIINKTNGGKQIEFSVESNQFEKKSKVGINEMFSNCLDSYRPVIIGFVQYQHSSVQLVLKKWIDIPS